jgi:DNA-binding Lrp family transcriptional regulator
VKFDMTGTEALDAKEKPAYTQADRDLGYAVSDLDRRLVLELQKDLPVVEEPFAPAAAALGLSLDELAAEARRLQEAGALRRVSAVFRHQAAGFRFNAMGVWAVQQDRLEELGNRMAEFKAVSHCYLRPTYEDWPYTIFTMVHGRSVEEAVGKIEAISAEVGDIKYEVLYSTKEYKKVRLEYFKPEFYEWEREHLG